MGFARSSKWYYQEVGLLDLLFPKTCVGCGKWGNYLCQACADKLQYLESQFCPECGRAAIGGKTHPFCQKKFGLDGLISFTYFSFPTNKIIHALKYSLTTALVSEVGEKIEVGKTLPSSSALLVPIPLHWQRKNKRGFNQAEILGKLYAEKLNLGFAPALLTREVKTRSQVGLKREERLGNVKNVFATTQALSSKKLVVFDDVWTTGATLRNACLVLKKAGAKEVWGLTLARSR